MIKPGYGLGGKADCIHNNPAWLPEDQPTAERVWRLKIYAMHNDPEHLLAWAAEDLPGTGALLA